MRYLFRSLALLLFLISLCLTRDPLYASNDRCGDIFTGLVPGVNVGRDERRNLLNDFYHDLARRGIVPEWPQDELAMALDRAGGTNYGLILLVHGNPLGFMTFTVDTEGSVSEHRILLHYIGTHPIARRFGLASSMIFSEKEGLLFYAKKFNINKIRTQVRASNVEAIQYLEGRGFKKVPGVKAFDSPPENAVTLEYQITDSPGTPPHPPEANPGDVTVTVFEFRSGQPTPKIREERAPPDEFRNLQ
ncbi:MAG: GNAT family N-acetyltransferase [Deltaproteobacteria bacterium]|nr:GNAT family N-acetyltransferase [Deltaproteobacteria bacterium]